MAASDRSHFHSGHQTDLISMAASRLPEPDIVEPFNSLVMSFQFFNIISVEMVKVESHNLHRLFTIYGLERVAPCIWILL